MAAFEAGKAEVLERQATVWQDADNLRLMRTLDVRRVLIVTNRPAIANSWFDDFARFIGYQTTYRFVFESPLAGQPFAHDARAVACLALNHLDEDPRIVEFLSLQDLAKRHGLYDKLKHIAQFDWDLLVIDEAHEGIDTKTDVAFDQIKRRWTLHLSGTPFKALASGKFDQDQIFNWTYEDEQSARQQWEEAGRENLYTAALPTLNLLTYQISRMITDRLAEGVAIDEDEANIDYTFDLNEFFATKDNGSSSTRPR